MSRYDRCQNFVGVVAQPGLAHPFGGGQQRAGEALPFAEDDFVILADEVC
jgi:hypothetical protein